MEDNIVWGVTTVFVLVQLSCWSRDCKWLTANQTTLSIIFVRSGEYSLVHLLLLHIYNGYNIGIQMKRKELTKTFYDDSKWKTTLWSPWFIQKYFSLVTCLNNAVTKALTL